MPPRSLLSRSFLLCFGANLFQGIAFNLFLHFPGFLKGLGADETQIGLIFGVTALTSIAVRPQLGKVMDTRGRRGVILLGSLVNVVAVGLYLTLESIGPWVYAVRIAHGLAEAMLFTSLFTYAADQVPEDRLTQGLAIFGVSGMLPISVGGVLGDAILEGSGFPLLFATSLGFAVLALALALPLRDRPRDTSSEPVAPRGFRAVLRQRDLIPLWWIATAFSIVLAAVFTFLKTFVMETGIGTVGGFFSGYTAMALVLRVFFGWLPDRAGPKRVLFPALAALGAGMWMLGAAESAAQVVLAGVLCGAGHGYTFPILFGLVVERSRDAERGSAMAIYTALFDVGLLLGAPSLGWIIEEAGYPAMYKTAAVLLVFGTSVFAWWDRRATA